MLPVGAHVLYKLEMRCRGLEKISVPDDDSTRYVVRLLHDSGPIKIALDDVKYGVALHADVRS